MKIKQEHYNKLENAIKATMDLYPNVTAVSYLRSGFTELRWRWDCLRAAEQNDKTLLPWVTRTLYSYLNDEHIDTALRAITKTD